MSYKKLYLSIALVIGGLQPTYAELRNSGAVSPRDFREQHEPGGTISVGFNRRNGSYEVNSRTGGFFVFNRFTSATASGLVIGQEGTTGTVRVIGNGTSGSAQINITEGFGLRNSLGGTGILEIRNGGVVFSNEQDVFLGNQGLGDTPGTATTLVDGIGSILRTQQGSADVFGDGGTIFVGFNGQSNSTVNVVNGGLVEALRNSTATFPAGQIFIGGGDSGSVATVNVSGAGSAVKADDFLEVGSRDTNTRSSLNINNGGQVQVFGNTAGADVFIRTIVGDATVNVEGNNSSLAAQAIQIGGAVAVAGFTQNGVPVIRPDFGSLVEGQQVSDNEGNLVFDRSGNPVLAEIVSFGSFSILAPATFAPENRIYVNGTGELIVENNATVITETIEVSTNAQPTAQTYNNQGATLTVRNGGVVSGDVTVNTDGVLNGDGGTIEGNVTIDGGTVAPGNSPGRLFINGDLDLSSGFLELEIGEFASDFLEVSGNVDIGEDLIISLLFEEDPLNPVLNLLSFFNVGGQFNIAPNFNLANNLRVQGLSSNFGLTVDLFGNQASFGNTGTSVPEPSSIILLTLGVASLRLMKKSKKSA